MLFELLVFYKYSTTLFSTGPLSVSMVAYRAWSVDLLGVLTGLGVNCDIQKNVDECQC